MTLLDEGRHSNFTRRENSIVVVIIIDPYQEHKNIHVHHVQRIQRLL